MTEGWAANDAPDEQAASAEDRPKQSLWASTAARARSLPQYVGKGLSEAGQLISKPGASVEVEVASVAWKPPVADVGDLPIGRRFDFHDEIHATTVWAVGLAPAEDHLTTLAINTALPGRESEGDQDRIEGLRNQVRTTMSRRVET